MDEFLLDTGGVKCYIVANMDNKADIIRETERRLDGASAVMEITSFEQLKSWERNPRGIADKALRGLKASIKRFGNLAEITFNKRNGRLVCGHQRIRAIKEEFDGQVKIESNVIILPTGARFPIQIVDFDEKTHAAASIAANSQRISGDFTEELAPLLDELKIDLPDLSLNLNFDDLRLDYPKFFRTEVIEDEVPKVPKEARTKRGDLYELNAHRVLCGDSTNSENVARLMEGQKIDALIADPPYGMNLNTDWSGIRKTGKSWGRARQIAGKKYPKVTGDDKPFDAGFLFELWFADEMFLFGADYYSETIPQRKEGSWMVWDKRRETQADGFGSEFELIWSKKKHKRRILRHQWFGFLREGESGQLRTHPTQKPIALIADMLEQWCGEKIVDPFLGSGSTLIAAHQTGRIVFGIEVCEAYCDVVVERYARFMRSQGKDFVIRRNGEEIEWPISSLA